MQTYTLTFDLEGARWTEVHRVRSRFVAIRLARAMMELLIAELGPKLALVAVNDQDDEKPWGGWDYAQNRPHQIVWAPGESASWGYESGRAAATVNAGPGGGDGGIRTLDTPLERITV
jgi:hypothetical protein